MSSPPKNLLSYLRVIVAAWRDDPRDDADLLARFVAVRDEAAFATLVGRHGPLVWQTCRSLLGNTPDAEDAFQAVFLALARKAGRFPVENLAGWLHRVARQAALDARTKARRRRGLEQRLRAITQPKVEEDAGRAELYATLDEELADLPERLRVPLLLHYIEGRSQVEVARLLGCGRSVLQRRLARAEAILRKRLERRGLGIGVGSLAAMLGGSTAAPAVPIRLIDNTTRAALRSLSFPPPLELSTSVALAKGMMKTMLMTKMKIVMVLLGVTLCLSVSGVLAYQALAGNAMEPPQSAGESRGEAEPSSQPVPDRQMAARVDCYGDPLPKGALVRLGTVRLRHPGNIFTVVFSSDGKTVASGGDGGVCLWEISTGKEIRTLQHENQVHSVAFSPDGKTVASGGSDHSVHLWEVATGKKIRTLQGDQGTIYFVAFAPDGKAVVSRDGGGTWRLWDVATGKEIRTLKGHQGKVFSILKGHKRGVCAVAFSPDGKVMASGYQDGTVRLWEANTGKEIRTLQEHRGLVQSVVFSPDGKTAASVGGGGLVHQWEVASGKLIRTLRGRDRERGDISVALAPDGKTMASGGVDRTVRLWDVATGKEIRTLGGHKHKVHSVAFASDGKTVVTGSFDGTLRLWEVATGKEIRILRGQDGEIISVAFASNGKTVASGGWKGPVATVRLWEVSTGKEIRTLLQVPPRSGHRREIRSVALTSDNNIVAACGKDGRLCLWEVATGKEVRNLRHLISADINSVAFSPDDKIVASGWGNTVSLWDVVTGRKIRNLKGHQEGVNSVAFAPDGMTLVSGGSDHTVRLWDVIIGEEIRTLRGHQRVVDSVAFSPNGRIVAAASGNQVQLWDLVSGAQLPPLVGHRAEICGVTFSPDGRTLASVSEDNTGLIWDLSSVGRLNLPARAFSQEQLEAAWADLAKEPAKAYAVRWALNAAPTQAVSLLRARVRPVAPVADHQQLKRWIADLDAVSFTVRDKAQREIGKLREAAIPALRQALKGQPALEVKRRLQDLLTELEPKASPHRLRELRAVGILESIGTAEAQQVLQAYAKGVSWARLTVEAQAALDRLVKRSVARP